MTLLSVVIFPRCLIQALVSLSSRTICNILQTYPNTQTPVPVRQRRDLLSLRNSPPADGAQSYTVEPVCTFCRFLSSASQRSPFSCRLNAFGIVCTFLQIDMICVHLHTSQWGDPARAFCL